MPEVKQAGRRRYCWKDVADGILRGVPQQTRRDVSKGKLSAQFIASSGLALLLGNSVPTNHISDVHADSSNFAIGTSKPDAYGQVHDSLKALLEDQRNWVCNTANAASLLWHMFHSLQAPSSAINWAGFYVVDKKNTGQLILGPFQGKVACQTIEIGKGVCGTVAKTGKTMLLEDVEKFPGHIACDSDSKSEIVVPIVFQGQVMGVIDIDCAEFQGFDETDRGGLESLARLLAHNCDW